jgi:hypothetical protein
LVNCPGASSRREWAHRPGIVDIYQGTKPAGDSRSVDPEGMIALLAGVRAIEDLEPDGLSPPFREATGLPVNDRFNRHNGAIDLPAYSGTTTARPRLKAARDTSMIMDWAMQPARRLR